MRKSWEWNGIEHWTGADLIETLSLISEQDEADSFMLAYGDLWDDVDDAIESLRYFIQIVTYDPDDSPEQALKREAEYLDIAVLLGVQLPSKDEVISPRHTFGNSSLGVKVKS